MKLFRDRVASGASMPAGSAGEPSAADILSDDVFPARARLRDADIRARRPRVWEMDIDPTAPEGHSLQAEDTTVASSEEHSHQPTPAEARPMSTPHSARPSSSPHAVDANPFGSWPTDLQVGERAAPGPGMVRVAPVTAGRGAGGRVKTRLLGFQPGGLAGPDPFAETACEADSPAAGPTMFPVGWFVVLEGPGRGAAFPLFNGASQIGRGEDQTVRLDFGDTSISRQNHAAVAYDDETRRFFLGHGGKSNLVRLNGRPVLSTEDLVHGDRVRIGETTLKLVALCGEDFSWTGDDTPESASRG